jgi:hypothetical protein
MGKKLAVVISGAVSLGSYEAGVTYEVLEAIAKHNEDSAPDDRIEIDVITGASAGGMTATILAKSLLCHGPTLRHPYENPLYKAWVEEVRMLRETATAPPGLLEVDRESHKYSLLNIETLDRIAKKILPDDIQSCPVDCPIADPHPAVNRDANNTPYVLLGLAMGNLNGFPLSLRLNQGVGISSSVDFTYSQYKDRFVMQMSRPDSDPTADLILEEWEEYETTSNGRGRWAPRQSPNREVTWSQLREITLSSGAFPFAFGVRQITRHSDQNSSPSALYGSRDSDRKRNAFTNDQDPFDGRYIYTDGGVFENEPIGLAISLIESIYGQGAIMAPDRYFLFIAPGARKASSDPFRSTKEADHISVGKALVSAIMGQSRFQDWIKQSRPPKVLAITSEDGKLLGDVFSAFAGFLEEKFRAYDYNIGRQTAQDKLGLLFQAGNSPIKQVPIEGPLWPPTRRLENAWVAGVTHTPNSWPDAMAHFGSLASISKTQNGQRDQIAELRALLANVEPTSRELIREQILDRVRSLVGYLYLSVPRKKSNRSLRGAVLNVGFWVMGLWALIRGRRTMENFAARLVNIWLKTKLEL